MTHEIENTFKFRTGVYMCLGIIVPFWIITLPLFWWLAYTSYKDGSNNTSDIDYGSDKKYCHYCKSVIPVAATVCAKCTKEQPEDMPVEMVEVTQSGPREHQHLPPEFRKFKKKHLRWIFAGVAIYFVAMSIIWPFLQREMQY